MKCASCGNEDPSTFLMKTTLFIVRNVITGH